jgi:hypothetical protein
MRSVCLTTQQPYREEDKRLTARKKRTHSLKAKRQDSDPSDIHQLATALLGDVTVLEKYPVDFNGDFGAG